MNARIPYPEPVDDQLLRYLGEHPSARVSVVARGLGIPEASCSLRVSKLRVQGFVMSGRGVTTLTPKGRVRFEALEPVEPSPETLPSLPTAALELQRPLLPVTVTEPRGSVGPDMRDLIDQLCGFQDPILQQANAQLRLEVTELRAERDDLRRRLTRAMQALGEALDHMTG